MTLASLPIGPRSWVHSARLWCVVTYALFCSGITAFGDLAWETADQTLPPDPQARMVRAVFKFQNTGDKPVSFKELKTSCRCATAKTEKPEYAPGERGEIVMTIDRQGRSSSNQVESTRITTSDGRTAVLVMRIQTAQFLKVKPAFLVWKRGEGKQTKQLQIEVTDPKAMVSNLTVRSNDPTFDTSVVPTEKGRFRIDITPQKTEEAKVATFTIEADYPEGQPGRIFAYAKVL